MRAAVSTNVWAARGPAHIQPELIPNGFNSKTEGSNLGPLEETDSGSVPCISD